MIIKPLFVRSHPLSLLLLPTAQKSRMSIPISRWRTITQEKWETRLSWDERKQSLCWESNPVWLVLLHLLTQFSATWGVGKCFIWKNFMATSSVAWTGQESPLDPCKSFFQVWNKGPIFIGTRTAVTKFSHHHAGIATGGPSLFTQSKGILRALSMGQASWPSLSLLAPCFVHTVPLWLC